MTSASRSHVLAGVHLGKRDRWLLLHASRTYTAGLAIVFSNRSERAALLRSARKLTDLELLECSSRKVYSRVRDRRREDVTFEFGQFWRRGCPWRLQASNQVIVWLSLFGERIVTDYGPQLQAGERLRWDPEIVRRAQALRHAGHGEQRFRDAYRGQREADDRAAAAPSRARVPAVPPGVASPGDHDRWRRAIAIALDQLGDTEPETLWRATRALYEQLDAAQLGLASAGLPIPAAQPKRQDRRGSLLILSR